MGRSKKGSIYPSKNGTYEVDAQYQRQRIRKLGFSTFREAEDYLTAEKQRIKAETSTGSRRPVTLAEAASRYITEQAAKNLPSWENDASMLKPLVKLLGSLTIDLINDDQLQPFIKMRKASGCKGKTINHSLGSLRAICNRAATEWCFDNGMTYLEKAPRISMVSEDDKRPPRPLTWAEQDRLVQQLPKHLVDMVLFNLNTGVREDVVCSLRWDWEAMVKIYENITASVFVVPRKHVKGRRHEQILVCNSIAQRIVDDQRNKHPDYVFTFPKPIGDKQVEHTPTQYINNSAWQKARDRAGLSDLHVHDLRHTVGKRLRLAGVLERTQDTILWHNSKSMTDHYAVAHLREIYDALELITSQGEEFETLDLHALIRRTQMRRLTENLPQMKKGLTRKLA